MGPQLCLPRKTEGNKPTQIPAFSFSLHQRDPFLVHFTHKPNPWPAPPGFPCHLIRARQSHPSPGHTWAEDNRRGFQPIWAIQLLSPISPTGASPPCTYSGLLHSRIAVFMPPPQVLEQVPKGLHVPHAPSITGVSRSLGTHIPNRQCCVRRREVGKVGLLCFCITSRPPATGPNANTHAYLFLNHPSQNAAKILQSNKIELLYFLSVTPVFFSSLHPYMASVGVIYGKKTEDNSKQWIFLVYWCRTARQGWRRWLFKKRLIWFPGEQREPRCVRGGDRQWGKHQGKTQTSPQLNKAGKETSKSKGQIK